MKISEEKTPEETQTSTSLRKWNAGDTAGMNLLLERHLPWIRNHVRKRMGPLLRRKAETDDCVQDAMIQFLQYGPRIHLSCDKEFRGLMVVIVENALRDRHDWFTACRRKIAHERPLPNDTVLSLDPPLADPVKRPSQAAQEREGEAWVRLGLEFLDAQNRDVVILRQWEGKTFPEIGEALGITAEAATMRYKRAVERLADKVGELRRRNLSSLLEESAS